MITAIMIASEDDAEDLYLEGIRSREDLGQLLKPRYLKWVMLVDGISDARKLLENPTITAKPCLQFYKDLIAYEEMQTELCKKSIRSCYEAAIRHFGDADARTYGQIKNTT